jgi:putative hemolysin
MNQMIDNRHAALWCLVWLLFTPSCDSKHIVTSTPQAKKVAIANPAAEKCVQDGYTQELLWSSEDVPTGALCVSNKTGQKCEEWAYFRGDCKLDVSISENPPSKQANKVTIANPATEKCLRDGYTWEPIMSSQGVPTGGVCIDKDTKSKCEEWSYFRDECYFDETFKPAEVSPPKKKLANPTN